MLRPGAPHRRTLSLVGAPSDPSRQWPAPGFAAATECCRGCHRCRGRRRRRDCVSALITALSPPPARCPRRRYRRASPGARRSFGGVAVPVTAGTGPRRAARRHCSGAGRHRSSSARPLAAHPARLFARRRPAHPTSPPTPPTTPPMMAGTSCGTAERAVSVTVSTSGCRG